MKTPVECVGGPFCGLELDIEREEAGSPPVYLLTHPEYAVWAYEWSNRSTPAGRWVLTALHAVGSTGAAWMAALDERSHKEGGCNGI